MHWQSDLVRLFLYLLPVPVWFVLGIVTGYGLDLGVLVIVMALVLTVDYFIWRVGQTR